MEYGVFVDNRRVLLTTNFTFACTQVPNSTPKISYTVVKLMQIYTIDVLVEKSVEWTTSYTHHEIVLKNKLLKI